MMPPLLAAIHDPPKKLFVRGALPDPSAICVAIVGSRKYTAYGQYVTELLVPPLVRAGIVIVSGLALGIDGIAHRAALAAGGKTVAVLGSGIDAPSIHPVAHTALAHQIVEAGGAVLSEYPNGFKATLYSFPARNRIIAGLSVGTVVIEAALKSGALITAQAALNENREVFAVPHAITSPTAAGVNELIKSGAHPVTSADDILDVLGVKKSARGALPLSAAATPEEKAILAALAAEPLHIDAILRAAALPGSNALAALTTLELNGLVKNLGGMRFARPQ
jgi:DNA processing protein